MKNIFILIILIFISRTLLADVNIRLRSIVAINELGKYEYQGKEAEKMESNFSGNYIFINRFGLGISKTKNFVGIDKSNSDNTKQLNEYELTSNWAEIYYLFYLTETTTLNFGLGKSTNGSGYLKTYDSAEYNTKNLSGYNYSIMIGFEYNPFFAPDDFLELLFGIKENYIKFSNFKDEESSPSNSSIDIKSFQIFCGLGILF